MVSVVLLVLSVLMDRKTVNYVRNLLCTYARKWLTRRTLNAIFSFHLVLLVLLCMDNLAHAEVA